MMQQMITFNQRPQDAYRRQGVLTASPVELVVMLYDGLKKDLILGRKGIEKRDVQSAHKYLMKAQDIVSELMSSLDMSFQISDDLFGIYEFILYSIKEANIHKNAEQLNPVIEIVESLREAWYEISVSHKGELHMEEGQA